MLYFAPLQGYTDFIFRKVYDRNFSGIDSYFIPYLSERNEAILKKQLREILPENNRDVNAIPQLLIKDSNEAKTLLKIIRDYGYSEVNVNMGCPYPMVTRTGRGSGLLPHPEKVREIMDGIFSDFSFTVSVKMRSGLVSENEIPPVVEVLNRFPLKEIIYHPRLASQLYKGDVNEELFGKIAALTSIPLVYNGNLFSKPDFDKKSEAFPFAENWMLGRGILMNPLLPEEIAGKTFTFRDKIMRLETFHDQLVESYSGYLSGSGHLLMKLKQFWEYFSHSFPQPAKTWKSIRKCHKFHDYQATTRLIFRTRDQG